MPLILAIEPDSRQASRLAALAKGPLRAELLVAESTAKAFAELGARAPDLVLTSLLLSPKDENELADRLRELDAAGIQVQTLVIPVLGTAARRSRQAVGGLLTRLRRSKGTSAVPEGCDPAVFAAQITEYLDRAAAERQAAAVALEDRRPTQQDPVYATRQEAQMAGSSSVGDTTARDTAVRNAGARNAAARDAAAREEAALEEAAFEAAALEEAVHAAAAQETAAWEAVAREAAAREQAARQEATRVAAAREAAARDAAAAREQAAREQVAREQTAREQAARQQAAREEAVRVAAAREAAARDAAAREQAAREQATREQAAREQAARQEATRVAAAREAAARDAAAAREQTAREKAAREQAAREQAAREQTARKEAARATAAREAAARDAAAAREHAAQEAAARSRERALDGDLAEFVAGIEAAAAVEKAPARRKPLAAREVPPILTSAPPQSEAPPPAAVDPVTQPEWKQLLTAIKRDIEHLRTEQPEAGVVAPRSSTPPPKAGRARTAGAKTRVKIPQPLQDEWGFFDPERCGFAALLTKLDAVTDPEDSPAKKPARPRH